MRLLACMPHPGQRKQLFSVRPVHKYATPSDENSLPYNLLASPRRSPDGASLVASKRVQAAIATHCSFFSEVDDPSTLLRVRIPTSPTLFPVKLRDHARNQPVTRVTHCMVPRTRPPQQHW